MCATAPTPSAPASSRAALWRAVSALRGRLDAAVASERFTDAAALRDEIEALSLTDEYVVAERALRAAVTDERFRDAARLRDELALLDPPPDRLASPGAGPSWSETTTDGIKVRVESYYMPEQSRPAAGQFLFGYRVHIKNEGLHTCQLVARRWTVAAEGKQEEEVRGPGVVGRQPVLQPGDGFEYTSACPVAAEGAQPGRIVGSMRGAYEMCRGDTGEVSFEVAIDPFYFRLPVDS